MNLSNRTCLSVTFDDFKLDIWNGKLEIKNPMMWHPPKSRDPRWQSDYLCAASSVILTFYPLESLVAYIFGTTPDNKLIVFKSITVYDISVHVEGYEENPGDKPVLNLKLIGGEKPKRKRLKKPTILELRQKAKEEARLRHLSAPSQSTDADDDELDESAHIPEVPVGQVVETPVAKVEETRNRKSSWAGFLKDNVAKLQAEVANKGLLETVKSKTSTVIKAAKNKMDEAVKHAKKKFGETLHTRITMLHEKLRGGEPIPRPRDLFVHVDTITFINVEVTTKNALPQSLRNFEKRTLKVTKLKLNLKTIEDPSSVGSPITHSLIMEIDKSSTIDTKQVETKPVLPVSIPVSHDTKPNIVQNVPVHPKLNDGSTNGSTSKEHAIYKSSLETQKTNDDIIDFSDSFGEFSADNAGEEVDLDAELDQRHASSHEKSSQSHKISQLLHDKYAVMKTKLHHPHDAHAPLPQKKEESELIERFRKHDVHCVCAKCLAEKSSRLEALSQPRPDTHTGSHSKSRRSESLDESSHDNIHATKPTAEDYIPHFVKAKEYPIYHGGLVEDAKLDFIIDEIKLYDAPWIDYLEAKVLHGMDNMILLLLCILGGIEYLNELFYVDYARKRKMTFFEIIYERFPPTPLCVINYKLERILLQEILRDTAGRVINDAWHDFAAMWKDTDEDETGGHITSTAAAASIPVHPFFSDMH